MINTGQGPPPPQSVLQENFLERMGNELVKYCDELERFGLVDYEMGVWEEEIVSSKTRSTLHRIRAAELTCHSAQRMSDSVRQRRRRWSR